MDEHAAGWANRLLQNAPETAVLELLLQGAVLAAVQDVWVAVTGADASANLPTWRALHLRRGDRLMFPQNQSGVWIYVAVEGGFCADLFLGSASTYARGGIGRPIGAGDTLFSVGRRKFQLPPGVAGRMAPALERRDYRHPLALRVWPAPCTTRFSPAAGAAFFAGAWTVSAQCDRVGYRLLGAALPAPVGQMLSEPVRTGTVQVPENGLPIVTMRDGPTVGGYARFGLLDAADVSRLAQCRPGLQISFRSM